MLRGSLEGCYSPPALRAASPQVGRRVLRASLEGCYSPPALRATSPQVGRRDSDRPMAQVTKVTGAESVRWDLSDLFRSPTDPAIEATLADALKRAQEFEAKYKGKVTTVPPKEFAAMMRELEE